MEDREYQKLAEVEDRMWYFEALHGLVEKELLKGLKEGAARILDAGCGTGGLIRRLAPKHPWSWTGVDLSPLACSHARARTGADILQASVSSLPCSAESFDAVVSADVLYHVEDDRAALREFHRVLRPGGLVILNVPAYHWLWSYHDVAVHSIRRYGRREVLEKLRIAGFVPIRATHWNCILFPLLALRRKLLPAPRGGSDVALSAAPVEAFLKGVSSVERAWIAGIGGLPFGSSVFAVGRKR